MITILARRELRSLFAAPATWWMLALLQFILGWFFLARVDDYLQVQAQLAQMNSAPGATISVAAPLAGALGLLLLMLIPLFSMRLIAEERRNQTWPLLASAPIFARQIVLGKFAGLLAFLSLIIAAAGLMMLTLWQGTPADPGLIAANLLGLWLLAASYAALGLYCSALTRQPVVAAFSALAMSFGLWLLEMGNGTVRALSPNAHFQNLNVGLVGSSDLVYFALFIALFLLLAIRHLQAEQQGWTRRRAVKSSLFLLLLLATMGGLYSLAARFPAHWDLTRNALNSLSPASAQVLAQLEGPLTITVYAADLLDAEKGEVRKLVGEFIGLYQRYKPDLSLVFVDPVKQPEVTRHSGIRGNGEMVVEFGGRREHLAMLNEQTLTSALLRLARGREELLMVVSGHGERKLDGTANHDLGEFGKRLQQNGYRIAPLNLAIAPDVPDNAGVLVITHPQTRLFPGEVAKLLHFVERGGNLLWLLDAEPLRGLEALAEALGLVLPPGIVIDPAAQEMNAPRDWALGVGYPPHPVTRDFDLITVFPRARALETVTESEWQRRILVEGALKGWISPQPGARFDPHRDVAGPVALALALQRQTGEHEQRIVVVGSGAFLANAYSGNGGNLDLGVNLLNWLAGEERLISIIPPTARDAKLVFSRHQLTIAGLVLLVLFPLLLIAAGGGLWWRRRT